MTGAGPGSQASPARSGLLARVFALDLRSLAAYRMGLAALVIADLLRRAMDLRAHYTDFGVLPRAAMLEYYTVPGKWSVHLFSGGAEGMAFIFVLHGLVALGMLVGWRTRLMTFFTALLTVSLHHRNPLILQGGDAVIRLGLFWSMFIPLGARWSIDALLADEDRSAGPQQVATVGTATFMLQWVVMYFMTGALKWHPVWHSEFTGVRYALSLEAFATSWGQALLEFPLLMKAASFTTLWAELIVPFVVLVPAFKGRIRLVCALGFMAFHMVLLEPALRLGYFTWAGACIWLAWLPPIFWDWVDRRRRLPAQFFRDSSIATPRTAWPLAAFLVFTLLYVGAWNLRTSDFKRWKKQFPRSVNVYANVLGLEQYWNLFAPYPLKDDGWYVVPGVFRDGAQRDLYRDAKPIDWSKPERGTPYYANQRWSKYMMNIWKKKFKKQRVNYGRWVCRDWNEGRSYDERLLRLQIWFMRERTLAVGEERPKPTRIWRHFCTKKPDKWEEYSYEAREAVAHLGVPPRVPATSPDGKPAPPGADPPPDLGLAE